MEERYKENQLYMGLVDYLDRGKFVTGIHVLLKTSYDTEMFDLNLLKTINDSGEEELFYPKTLISFGELLSNSRINWNTFSREDSLKAGYFLSDKYLKFLRTKRVSLTRGRKL